MTDYGVQKIVDVVENMVVKARVYFSNGQIIETISNDKKRTNAGIEVRFYIPASNSERTMTRVEYLDEKGNVVDRQIYTAKIARRRGFMTLFEYNYSEVN